MKKLTFYTYAILVSFVSFSQAGWNWPEDEGLKGKAIEKQAYYKVLMAQNEYDDALKPLNWLYTNNPNLNQSIYIDGVKCLSNVAKEEKDAQRKTRLQDSVLWMFDQRLEYFDNDASTMDRKAYEAFKLYYRTPAKYPLLADLFEKAYEMNGEDVSYFNLNPYMMLATNYYKSDPSAMPAEKVLDIHTKISDIIEAQKNAGGNSTRLEKEQAKVDGFLGSVGDILNCEFIESKLVPKFREDRSDISTAKKIFTYSVKGKCTDKPYFMEASETVFEAQPSFKLANVMASRYVKNKEYAKAVNYYSEAAKLAQTNEEKAEAYLGQASTSLKLGNKSKARSLAYESLSAKPGNPDAYNLIGNLYFSSFKQCQGGESKVLDRGVFIAAYEMYQKAGNTSQMNASKEQFPSIEEIFNESYEEGETINVGCWINETVALQRR
ncbi:MAG: tetratricopeptide repeat protein [Bacteroidota bacterium]